MKKVLLLMGISASFLFSAMDVQTASKKDLMCIKGNWREESYSNYRV